MLLVCWKLYWLFIDSRTFCPPDFTTYPFCLCLLVTVLSILNSHAINVKINPDVGIQNNVSTRRNRGLYSKDVNKMHVLVHKTNKKKTDASWKNVLWSPDSFSLSKCSLIPVYCAVKSYALYLQSRWLVFCSFGKSNSLEDRKYVGCWSKWIIAEHYSSRLQIVVSSIRSNYGSGFAFEFISPLPFEIVF